MAEFLTSNGYRVLIDDEDYEAVTKHRWLGNSLNSKRIVYVQRGRRIGKGNTTVYLHRQITNAPRGKHVGCAKNPIDAASRIGLG